MCCAPMGWHWGPYRCWWALCCPGSFRFLTKEEEIAHLERYLKALQAEVKDVEKRIAELKGKE